MSGCKVTSVLCLHYRPETVHCSTKDVYNSEITFPTLHPCFSLGFRLLYLVYILYISSGFRLLYFVYISYFSLGFRLLYLVYILYFSPGFRLLYLVYILYFPKITLKSVFLIERIKLI